MCKSGIFKSLRNDLIGGFFWGRTRLNMSFIWWDFQVVGCRRTFTNGGLTTVVLKLSNWISLNNNKHTVFNTRCKYTTQIIITIKFSDIRDEVTCLYCLQLRMFENILSVLLIYLFFIITRHQIEWGLRMFFFSVNKSRVYSKNTRFTLRAVFIS